MIPIVAFIFGSVAVLRSWKGHLDLLEAFHSLLQQGARAFLLLVGEGPYRVVIDFPDMDWKIHKDALDRQNRHAAAALSR